MSIKEARCQEFLADNPHVYELFDMFTRQAIASGARRYSAYAVINRIRWHTTIETVNTVFKISNDHIPYLCRRWLRENPEHKDFFVIHATKEEMHYLEPIEDGEACEP